MKKTRLLSVLFLCATCGLLWAQTNKLAKAVPEQEVEIDSTSGYYDGLTNQIVYMGHVVVTDHVKAKLTCEWLTVDLPPGGGHPTNIVAETNVVIDMLDENGKTNHVTADKVVYAFHLSNPVTNLVHSVTNTLLVATNVVYAVTNETVTFTGGNPKPKVETPDYTITGDTLVYDLARKKFSGIDQTIYKPHKGIGTGTNSSPFDIFKK